MMKDEAKNILNYFFVNTFNKIMAYEEHYLTRGEFANLTVKEFHAIEAVADTREMNENTMSNIAGQLTLSVGSLTTTMNVLVRKGYVQRRGSTKDRRIIYIELTEMGEHALAKHRAFHEEMIENTAKVLAENEYETLISALDKLSQFFTEKNKEI